MRSGALERERVVHFETWAIEAVAAAAGLSTPLPMAPFPERALPSGTPGLDRLEAAREAVATAPREDVAAALDRLDRVFEEVAGRAAVRGDGDSGGGRTVAYLDCMRDLDVTLGPEVLDELRRSLPLVLSASRWWCGRVFDRGAELLGQIAQPGPLAPQLGPLMGAGFGLWDQMGAEQRELQRRWAAGDEFADWTPAWYGSNYHSADLQIAAAERRRDRARRLPHRARRLPRRRQPARAERVRDFAMWTRRRSFAASPPRPARASTSRRRATAWSR